MFDEDLSVLFADFGVPAVYGTQTATVNLDQPDQDMLSGRMVSREYLITYKLGDLAGLNVADAITVDGADYKVREVHALDDGRIITALLSKL